MNRIAPQILATIRKSEAAGDFGAWSVNGHRVGGVVVCSSLCHRFERTAREVKEAVADLRKAGSLAPEAVRLQPHVKVVPAEVDPDDLDGSLRSEMVRKLSYGPCSVADLVGADRAGHAKRVLQGLYLVGEVAPMGALWSIR